MRSEPSFSTDSNSENLAGHDSPFLDDYRQRYGLSCDPFADDPHFPFYTGAQRRVILEKLVHLCQFANNLLVVIGEYSTGKTRIAQALIDSLQDEDDICFLEGQINSRFTDLLEEIVEQFDLGSADDLTDFFEKTSESEGVAVVIIDNAHHLDDDTLRELVLLMQPNSESRLRIVFLGEPLLLQRLEKMDASHVVMTDFSLDRFDLSESVDYLNFRMEMSDYLGPEIFNETIVESWWRSANGQIDRLHACAQQKLLESVSASNTRSNLSGGFPITHIMAVAVLAAILFMGFIYFGSDSGKSKKETNYLTNNVVSKASQTSSSSTTVLSNLKSSVVSEVVSTEVSVEVEPNSSQEQNLEYKSEVQTSAASSSITTKLRKRSELPVSTNGNNLVSDEKKKTGNSSAVAKVEEASSSALNSNATNNAKERSQVNSEFSEQEKKILSWDDSEHTIQLVGLSSEKSALEYIAHQTNRDQLLMFRSSRQGRDWFVVIYGHYATIEEAKEALKSLTESQQKASPWFRTVRIIKKEIRTR